MTKETEGYVLVAIGEDYLNLATNLIDTLRKNGDERDVYVITESDQDDLYLSCRTDFERFGTIPKISLDKDLPFDHNIFLDADSLCAANTDHVWEWFRSNDQFIQQFGTYKRNNPYFPMDNIDKYESELGYFIPKVHGGIIYINRNTLDPKFFEWMREVGFPKYQEILHSTPLTYKNSRPDQEIYSLAHGKFGLKVWEIWDHPVLTIVTDVQNLPTNDVFFRGKKGPKFDKQVPFVHVFKGKYAPHFGESGGTKYHMPHYGELYTRIMNS